MTDSAQVLEAGSARQIILAKSSKGRAPGIPETSDQQELWDYFQHNVETTGRTDFFGSIKIDRQAGFDELGEMWGNGRYLMGALAVLMLFFNIFAIANLNYTLLSDATFVSNESASPIDEPDIYNEKLKCLPDISFVIAQRTWAPYLFGNIAVKAQGLAAISFIELCLLLLLLVWAIWNFVKIFIAKSVCMKWHSIANFFFNVFPMIATLSLVKILNYVTPAVLVPDLIGAIKDSFTTKTGSCALVWFVATRGACILFGFDAFLFKFQLIAEQWRQIQSFGEADLVDNQCFPPVNAVFVTFQGTTVVLINTLVFVNQLLGIVQLGWFTKQRIFVFIFAGEDGAMSQQEYAVKLTFDAYLCHRIQEEHGLWKAIFFWWTYSDADFQKMVLDDKDDTSGEEAHQEAKAALRASKELEKEAFVIG